MGVKIDPTQRRLANKLHAKLSRMVGGSESDKDEIRRGITEVLRSLNDTDAADGAPERAQAALGGHWQSPPSEQRSPDAAACAPPRSAVDAESDPVH